MNIHTSNKLEFSQNWRWCLNGVSKTESAVEDQKSSTLFVWIFLLKHIPIAV